MKLKLKLSRSGYFLLGSLILGIVFIFLYISYLGQSSERDSLSNDVSKVQSSLPKVTSESRSLDSQIAQLDSKVNLAKTTLKSVKGSFSADTGFAYGEQLSRLADNDSVRIISIKASTPSDEKHDAITFSVTTFELKVAGKTANLLTFAHDLISRQSFISASVNSIAITEMDKGEASLNISMAVYGYKGS